jgi:hypothetical protein
MATAPARPTAVIRLSVTTMSARSITSLPRMVMTRAPLSTATPLGLYALSVTLMLKRRGVYAGRTGSVSAPRSGNVSPASRRGQARAIESVRARMASAMSYKKKEWPSEKVHVAAILRPAGKFATNFEGDFRRHERFVVASVQLDRRSDNRRWKDIDATEACMNSESVLPVRREGDRIAS